MRIKHKINYKKMNKVWGRDGWLVRRINDTGQVAISTNHLNDRVMLCIPQDFYGGYHR